jgi:hypothetical protein
MVDFRPMARLRRNFTMSPRIDKRLSERAQARGDSRSRELERCVDSADCNDASLRMEIQPAIWRITKQLHGARSTTMNPQFLEAVTAIEKELAGISAKLAAR